VTRVPIACTLTQEATVDRVAEWREFLSTAIVTTELGDTTARALLKAGDDVLLRAVNLAK
jgi:hypothetical protein